MHETVNLARRVAMSEVSCVLLQGESGTGKDCLAKAMHYASKRAGAPFIAINCAALPSNLIESELFGHEKGAFTDAKSRKEGLLEQADDGTILLDEIGELDLNLQAKLLRVLEEGFLRRGGGLKDVPFTARVIAASNRDLRKETDEGRFRLDLYFRLAVIKIDISPLRQREDDVLLLAFCAAGLVLLVPKRFRAAAAIAIPCAVLVPWLLRPTPDNWICWKESQVNSVARRAWTREAAAFLAANYKTGDGILGAHGGSYLSTLGGTVRLGEFRPGTQMRHALKVNVFSVQDLGLCVGNINNCYTWPAAAADGYAANAGSGYGSLSGNSNAYMKMGALLAIPSSVNINSIGLQSEPGKMLAWTLQNYGAYIVDSRGSPGFDISVEDGADGSKLAEFKADFGFDMEGRLGYTTLKDATGNFTPQAKWIQDVRLIIDNLRVVTNNNQNNIGGGGVRLQPLAPPFQ